MCECSITQAYTTHCPVVSNIRQHTGRCCFGNHRIGHPCASAQINQQNRMLSGGWAKTNGAAASAHHSSVKAGVRAMGMSPSPTLRVSTAPGRSLNTSATGPASVPGSEEKSFLDEDQDQAQPGAPGSGEMLAYQAVNRRRTLAPAQPWNVPAPVPKKEPGYKSGVLIVGGGPVGLATALMLARRGWTDITIVEKRAAIDEADRDRSYVYQVDARGRKMLCLIPGLVESLDRYGVCTSHIDITRVMPDGKAVTSSLSVKDPTRLSHWMPRSALLRLLRDEGLVPGQQEGWAAGVTVLLGTEVASVEQLSVEQARQQLKQEHSKRQDGLAPGFQSRLRVRLRPVGSQPGSSEERVLYPRLIVGADGFRSVVRDTLASWDKQRGKAGGRGRFEMLQFSSPAADLRYKVLNLPPNPVVSKAEGALPMDNQTFAVVLSRQDLPQNKRMRLGFLPIRDKTAGRTANAVTRPGHALWDVTTAEGLYQFFEEIMPNFRARELIPLQEAEAFAKSRGGRFPAPQYCPGLVYSLEGVVTGDGEGNRGSVADAPAGPAGSGPGLQQQVQQLAQGASGPYRACGVVLMGDSRAAFPPDLGQGVNSGLEDIAVLADVLSEHDDDLSKALPAFEARRAGDIRALIELMTFSAPYQYNQSKQQFMLWGLNIALRDALHKLLPSFFHPHSFKLIQDASLSYRQALERAHATTARILAVLAAVVAAVGYAVWRVLSSRAAAAALGGV